MWKALIKLVEKWACGHEWKQFGDRVKTYGFNYIEGGISKQPTKIEQTLICNKCGKIKRIEL